MEERILDLMKQQGYRWYSIHRLPLLLNAPHEPVIDAVQSLFEKKLIVQNPEDPYCWGTNEDISRT